MPSRPYPDKFRGRISFPRHVVITGDLEPVYDTRGVIKYWLVYTPDRDAPSKIDNEGAAVEPIPNYKKLDSNTPRGKPRGR